jgi:hypothetical protein
VTPVREDICVDDLAVLPPDMYYELIDGQLVGVPGISIDQILMLDQAVAARTRPHPAEGIRPAVVVVGPLPIDETSLDLDQGVDEQRLRQLVQGAKVYVAAGLQHWWMVELTLDGNLNLVVYSPDSIAFPGPYLATDYLPVSVVG